MKNQKLYFVAMLLVVIAFIIRGIFADNLEVTILYSALGLSFAVILYLEYNFNNLEKINSEIISTQKNNILRKEAVILDLQNNLSKQESAYNSQPKILTAGDTNKLICEKVGVDPDEVDNIVLSYRNDTLKFTVILKDGTSKPFTACDEFEKESKSRYHCFDDGKVRFSR